jgi:DNA-binding CsgD family transcriptional regulator
VASSPTVIEAADRLEVSRSNVYASLRRIARKLGVATVSDLVVLARSGGLS